MKNKSGQTLVILLVFIAVGVSVTAAAATLSFINASSSSRLEQGQTAYDVAESGIENALMSYLRNPGYTGETLTVSSGSSTITVSGTNPITITSRGKIGNFSRTIQVTAQSVNGILTVLSWKEIYN